MSAAAFDSVSPPAIVRAVIEAGAKKAILPPDKMVLSGMAAGMLLGIATSLAITVWTQPFGNQLPILGAFVFPVGFCMLVLCGCELVTGNMMVLPMAYAAGKATPVQLCHSFTWVTLGNLLGSLLYAFLFWASYSGFGNDQDVAVGVKVREISIAKTVGYEAAGARGWFAAFIKAILCNWMVSLGLVMSFTSKSTIGRVAAMWMPIMVFFAHGYEHAVVNFFVIPAGIFFGSDVTFLQWWGWNQIPVLLGNAIGASFLTGLPLAYLHPLPQTLPSENAQVDQSVTIDMSEKQGEKVT